MAEKAKEPEKLVEKQEGISAPPKIDKAAIFDLVSESLNADLFVYSGSITRESANNFLNEVEAEVENQAKRENVALVLCTYGGDPDAAYIIARFLKSHYKKFTLYVFGFCKSAGTLIALGADEIIMSIRGELGPLDVQTLKRDDLIFRSSGLDITQAIESLSERTYEVFIQHFYESIMRTRGAMTTKTAADIASSLAVGLIAPITAQIDPLRVGEMERAMTIAYHYGIRLNGNAARVNKLIRSYPSHTFVIDYAEATDLFGNVREPSELENLFEMALKLLEQEQTSAIISSPNEEIIIGSLKKENENETTDGSNEREQNEAKLDKASASGTAGKENGIKEDGESSSRRNEREGKNGDGIKTVAAKT